MRTDIRGDAIIIGAALVYGTGLVAQSSGNSMGPWSFASAGFLLGAAALFPVVLYHRIKKSTAERAKDRSIREMAPGALAVAAVLVICVITQHYGLIYTSVGKAGFITSLYVIEVPIAGLFLFKRRLSWRIWIAAAISMTGLYFVSITEGIESVNSGDVLLLITSFSYVAYMYQMEHYAKDSDPLTFTLLTTFFTVGSITPIIGIADSAGTLCRNSHTCCWLYIADDRPEIRACRKSDRASQYGVSVLSFCRNDHTG